MDRAFPKIIATCGHELDSMTDGVSQERPDWEGTSWGLYCKKCAAEYVAGMSEVTDCALTPHGESVQKMAEAHCEYMLSVCRTAYLDAFIHGFKHGKESK